MISFSSNSLFSVQVSFYFVRFVISWLCSILFELSFHFVRTVILFCLNCHFILFKLSFYFVQTVIFCSVLLLDTSLAGPHFGNDSTGTCCQVHKCVLQIAPPPPPYHVSTCMCGGPLVTTTGFFNRQLAQILQFALWWWYTYTQTQSDHASRIYTCLAFNSSAIIYFYGFALVFSNLHCI